MEPSCFGRCAMNTNRWLGVALGVACLAAGVAAANPSATVPVDPVAEAAYQLETPQIEQDWRLDPTVFTDISPVSVPEVAIKLPDDQEEDG